MKRFYCDCGAEIFFENQFCGKCGRSLGFDFDSLTLIPITHEGSSQYSSSDGHFYRLCGNWSDFNICNWLVPNNSSHRLCHACQFNRIIPNQTVIDLDPPKNFFRWYRLEEAKRRLIYTLANLGLRLTSGWINSRKGLLFDFIEDHKVGTKTDSVTTGYASGVITINSKEADDVERIQARSALNERQRTVLGHFRHELGHFCWDRMFSRLPIADYFAEVFGETELTYQDSINRYYKKGPSKNWHEGYISAYATSHPSEDWAETWNHYLLIHDCLETAKDFGLVNECSSATDTSVSLFVWRELAVKLNQLNRSIGLNDAYPFVISRRVEEKLSFVNQVLSDYKREAL